MSPTPIPKPRAFEPPQVLRAEGRLHQRYLIAFDLEYEILKRRRVQHLGFGRTINISSSGVLFEAKDIQSVCFMDCSEPIVLKMNWPLSLSEVCALKLEMRGHIVRIDGRRIAMKIDNHEFRTGTVALKATPRLT